MLCFQILSCLPAAGRYKEKIDGKIHTSDLLLVGDNYLSTLGCEIIEGRNFLINSKNDANESVIVNEDFIRTFIVLPILKTTRYTFLVEIQKVFYLYKIR